MHPNPEPNGGETKSQSANEKLIAEVREKKVALESARTGAMKSSMGWELADTSPLLADALEAETKEKERFKEGLKEWKQEALDQKKEKERLVTENAELRKEKERLDWLESSKAILFYVQDRGLWSVAVDGGKVVHDPTIREALDTSRTNAIAY